MMRYINLRFTLHYITGRQDSGPIASGARANRFSERDAVCCRVARPSVCHLSSVCRL